MKQVILKNRAFKALILVTLFALQTVSHSCLAMKILGDPGLKAQGYISKASLEHYTIGRDNELSFNYVLEDGEEKDYSNLIVFPNGTMIIPKVGEEFVYGKTVEELQALIKEKNPKIKEVEIFVTRIANNYSVLGEVQNPGSFKLEDVKTIYDGLAKAKGFTETAKKSKVKLIRQREDGSRYTYVINFPKEVFNAYSPEDGIGKEAYLLEEGDLIYVDGSMPKKVWKIFKTALGAATLGVFAGMTSAFLN